jgi:hypothetical protein
MADSQSAAKVILGFFLGAMIFIVIAAASFSIALGASKHLLLAIPWIATALLVGIDVLLFRKAAESSLAKGAAISVSLGILLSAICGVMLSDVIR